MSTMDYVEVVEEEEVEEEGREGGNMCLRQAHRDADHYQSLEELRMVRFLSVVIVLDNTKLCFSLSLFLLFV